MAKVLTLITKQPKTFILTPNSYALTNYTFRALLSQHRQPLTPVPPELIASETNGKITRVTDSGGTTRILINCTTTMTDLQPGKEAALCLQFINSSGNVALQTSIVISEVYPNLIPV